MANLAFALERLRRRQRVRYWALALPTLIIVISLPLLRPLRHPDPRTVSDDEWLRIETIRQIATKGTFDLDPERVRDRSGLVIISNPPPTTLPSSTRPLPATLPATTQPLQDRPTRILAAQEPMLSLLAAGVYQLLRLARVTMGPDIGLGPYLLTLILSTLPVAFTATVLYRCARLLELSRPRRTALALAAVIASGLLPYATVISPLPLAALCIAGSLACVAHVATLRPWPQGAGWLLLAGFLAGLATALHPAVACMALCLALVSLAMPWRSRTSRTLALLVFAIGAVPPLATHRLTMETLGLGWTATAPNLPDTLLATTTRPLNTLSAPSDSELDAPEAAPETSLHPLSPAHTAAQTLLSTLLGTSGLVSNSPAILIALCAVSLMLVRHWPATTRAIALACTLGVIGPVLLDLLSLPHLSPVSDPLTAEQFYGSPHLLVVTPLLLIWAGVYLRQGWSGSRVPSLAITGWTLIALSCLVSLAGLVGPMPRGGFHTYPPFELLKQFSPFTSHEPPAS